MMTETKKGSAMSEKMIAEFNEQIKLELESAYIYLAMSADLEEKNWEGMAKWMKGQSNEEVSHAMKFYHHLLERGARIKLHGIQEPQQEWKSPLDIFSAAYEHEKFVTGRIHHLYKLAQEENDYPAQVMLQWFVEEQVEEEDSTLKIREKLNKIGDSMNGLFMLDHELGKRE
jgi:ferritin